jgi:Protein of unknown function (DUF2283)
MMKGRYLEMTFRKGRPLAAYLHLPRAAGVKSARTEEMAPGILADFAASGEPIGLEITAPTQVTAEQINAVLTQLCLAPITPEELAPLKAL